MKILEYARQNEAELKSFVEGLGFKYTHKFWSPVLDYKGVSFIFDKDMDSSALKGIEKAEDLFPLLLEAEPQDKNSLD